MINSITYQSNNISFQSRYPIREIKHAISHFKYQDDYIRKLDAKNKLKFVVEDGVLAVENNFMMPKVKEAKGLCHELSKLSEHYLEKLFPDFYFYRVMGNEQKFFNRGRDTNHYFNIGMHKDDERLLDVFFDAINNKKPQVPEGSLVVDSCFGVVTENPTHKILDLVNPFGKPTGNHKLLGEKDDIISIPIGFLNQIKSKKGNPKFDDMLLYYELSRNHESKSVFDFRLKVKKAYNKCQMFFPAWQKTVNTLPDDNFLKIFIEHMKKYEFINFV